MEGFKIDALYRKHWHNGFFVMSLIHCINYAATFAKFAALVVLRRLSPSHERNN